MQGKTFQDSVIDKIDSFEGQGIIALGIQGKSSITSCVIICMGTSSHHIMSITNYVAQESRTAGLLSFGVESESSANWIVVDLGDVTAHVIRGESRRLYELGELWS